jgi:predicted TIM-barrel fold metal-dependent hydrolase
VVFIHPTQPPGFARLSLGLPAPVLEYPFDSTRAINSLILSGTLSRCPDIRFIVSHGGGTIPYLAPRFAPFMAAKPGEPLDLLGPGKWAVMEMLRHLYFDLTASTHPGALAAMLRLMPVSQLPLGFDFPFMPPTTIAPAIASLESFDGLSPDDQQAIAGGNARRLLPKVGAR